MRSGIPLRTIAVERFPIYEVDQHDPDDEAARDAIEVHIDTMLDLHAQRVDATTDAQRDRLQERIDDVDAQIGKQVYALYGLGTEEIGIVEENVEQ